MKQFKWLLLALLVVVFAWRIVVVNVAQYLALKRDVAALQWKADIPSAMRLQADTMLNSNTQAARELTLLAAWLNPADGHTFAMLALLLERQGHLKQAKAAAEMANLVMPRNADVQLKLGAFWAMRGEPIEAVKHWSMALEARPKLAESLFPAMLGVAEIPQLRDGFAGVFKGHTPRWWANFFNYALQNAVHENTLMAIYQIQTEQYAHDVRQAYLDHLLEKALYTDAYFIWLNGLDTGELNALGNVYNGGFEYPIKDEGFGWRMVHEPAYKVAAESTFGHTGRLALHVALQEEPRSSRVIYQYLMLDAGQYELRGRVRPEGLNAGKGVYWQLTCMGGRNQALVSNSGYFTGSDNWQRFTMPATVPVEGCPVQTLALVIDKGLEFDQTGYGGAIWIDDLEMVKLNS